MTIDPAVFFAEIEADHITMINDFRREWGDKWGYTPNLLIVKKGYFKNLSMAHTIFGCEIFEVEFLADHQGNEIFFAFGVK